MKIVYYCHTGAHISLIAAAVHLGLLPAERKATAREIKGLPFFNSIKMRQIGTPFFVGEDPFGNKIYTLGLGYELKIMGKALKSFFNELGIKNDYKLVNTIPAENKLIKYAGFMSAFLGWDKLAQPLLIHGINKQYQQVTSIVERVIKDIYPEERGNLFHKVIPFPTKRVKNIYKN